MSTYVMSDIHGHYVEYLEMLKKIDLKPEDTLYILGDVVDRGPNPIKLLTDMMARNNVEFIVGNHELMAVECLEFLINEITEESLGQLSEERFGKLLNWIENGARPTMDEFYLLSMDERKDILDYIINSEVYAELRVGGVDYILVHAGLKDFSPEKDLEDYYLEDLVWFRPDYNKPYYEDRYVVTGHTPTNIIEECDRPGYIMKKNNHIAIDCGASFGIRLGCICLETGEEFYVECKC